MSETISKTKQVYFPNLDILRFVAAFMVIFVHAYEGWCGWFGKPGILTIGDYKTLSTSGRFVDQFINNGSFGVDIFFLISGFLITYIMLVEKEKTGKIDFVKFYTRRTFRIWPLYFFLVAITPLLVKWLHKDQPDYLSVILFYNNFKTMYSEQWTFPFAHYWSICIEEHFYLVWPFIVAFINNKKLPVVFWGVIFISIVSRAYFSSFGFSYMYLFLHTLSRIDVMAMGALVAYYHFKNPFKLTTPLSIRIMLFLLFAAMYSYEPYNNWGGVFLACFRKYFYCGIVGFLMMNYLFNEKALFNFKKKNILHYLGKISYGIYMYGNIVLIIAIEKIIVNNNIHNIYAYFSIVIGLTLLIAAISYETLERYFLKLKTRFEVVKTVR
jgi:peptidoglycan/LPS O-acetylase OafA/YrhL